MTRPLAINLGLLVFIVSLGGYLLLSDQTVDVEPALMTELDRNTINRIEVIRQDMNDFVFEKDNEQWFMRSPLQIKANIARINAMLRLLETESHAQLNPAENPLDRFKLDKPDIIMKLNDYEFRFGNTDAIDQHRYVLFDNIIHLTSDFLYQQLSTNAAFFAELKLLPEGFDIKTIRFPENELNKVNDQWQLKTLMDINPTQLQHTVSRWQNAIAISASTYKEPETKQSVSITDENNQTIEFVIVGTEPHLILGRQDLGLQFHMGSDDAEKLLLKENPPPTPEVE